MKTEVSAGCCKALRQGPCATSLDPTCFTCGRGSTPCPTGKSPSERLRVRPPGHRRSTPLPRLGVGAGPVPAASSAATRQPAASSRCRSRTLLLILWSSERLSSAPSPLSSTHVLLPRLATVTRQPT